MVNKRRILLIVLLASLTVAGVSAQDTTTSESPTPEPPTATIIPPTDIPPTPLPPPTDVPTETFTPEPSLTPLPPPTDTSVPTATDTASPEASLTPSETSTDASSPTLTATATASVTVSLTPSMTASAQIQNQIGVIQPLDNPITCTPSASIQQANVSSAGDRGDTGNVSGNMNSLSSDGRYLYFPSQASNLVADDTNGMVDYFEFDRTNCQTRRVTVGANGEEGNDNSFGGNVSGNGQYFAFTSKASNLVANDTNGKSDIFVKNLSTNAITRIPADPNNVISGSYAISDVTISDDGRYVAFDLLVSVGLGGLAGTPILFDTQTSTRTVIASEGRYLYISGDGNFIAFVSSASNLVAGDTNNVDDVFVYQRTSGTFDRVSIATNGAQTLTTQNYYNLAISSDGRFVSFDTADALVANDTNGTLGTDIYVRDRLTNQTSRVSVNNDGSQFASGVGLNRMSADGRYVTFMTSSTAIWVRDLVTSQTYQITNPYSSNGGLDISVDGSYIAFSTQTGTAPNITRDVYIAKRLDFALTTPTPTPTNTISPATQTAQAANMTATAFAANCASLNSAPLQIASVSSDGVFGNVSASDYYIALSDTGRYVVYASDAWNLVTDDTNNKTDVFMFDRQTCQTSRLSTALNGNQANDLTYAFAISSDAQIIAMWTKATNLVSGVTTGGIYVRNLTANTLVFVPNTSQTADYVSISGDGRYLTYTESPDASTRVVIIYDLQTNQRTSIATMNGVSVWSKISSDGSSVVYRNETGGMNIFNRTTQQTILPSLGLDPIYDFDISANGRYVSFQSSSTSLVPNDTNAMADVFVVDTQTNQITRVSVASDGSQANNTSAFSSISPDGRYVTFVSTATNLVSGDNNNKSDVFVHDRTTNQTFLISARINGTLGNVSSGGYTSPISADNRFVAFFSFANTLVDGDSLGTGDIFVANLQAYQTSVNATATAVAPATQTAGAPATQTAVAATATAGPFATQTAAAATATHAAANTIVVNSLTAAGSCTPAQCTLEQAISTANNSIGIQIITFNIPGSGVHRITISSPLIITDSVIIDGTTQPGYSDSPLIEITPLNPATSTYGIVINGATPTIYDPNTSDTIRGLAINGFTAAGILVGNGQQHIIEDNYIGTDPTGTMAVGNGTGIIMRSPNNIIRNNLISGNEGEGVYLYSNGGRNATNNIISGNLIGTDITGTFELPNVRGIRLSEGAVNTLIGGSTADAGNLISGNLAEGVLIIGNINDPIMTSGNVIAGNTIGLDSSGSYLLGNGGAGIIINGATNTTVGGLSPTAGNEIWGNTGGISLINGVTDTLIRNNTIAQNSGIGLSISANSTTILENSIAFHTASGIVIASGVNNRVSANSVFSNGVLGIDLGANAVVNANDVGDVDAGANNFQNMPTVSSVFTSGSVSTITGVLNSQPNATYHIEFFATSACNSSGYGEGQNYVGSFDVITNGSGLAAYTLQVPAIDSPSVVTATAIDSSGNTSEFSACQPVRQILGLGSYPENHPAFYYSGSWLSLAGAGNGGSFKYTNTPNASMSFWVDSSVNRITLYRTLHPLYGTTQIFLDGATSPTATVNNTSATVIYGVPFTIIVPPGNHKIEIRNIGSNYSSVDQIDLLGAGTPLSTAPGIYQESDINLTYIGNWIPNNTANAFLGSRRYTNDPNGTMSFRINNTVGLVTIYRTTYNAGVYGSMQVFLDNNPTPIATLNNTSSGFLFKQPYTFAVSPGSHTITLKNVGSTYSDIDQLTLQAAPTPFAAGTYQETQAGLIYNGIWTQANAASAAVGARKFTNDPYATVSFTTDSTVGLVTIYRTTYNAGVYGSMQVFLDNNPTPIATLNNTSSGFLFQQPFTFAVTAGVSHIITLKNVGSTYSDIDQIVLQTAASPLTAGTYQETQAGLIYNGIWTQANAASAAVGARKFTNDPNGTVSFTTDSAVGLVTIYRTTYNAGVYGSMQVFLDNNPTPIATLNNTSSGFLFQQPYTFAITAGVSHIITLKNVGSTYSDIDQIVLQTAPTPFAASTYQETQAGLIYNGIWTQANAASAAVGARKFTNDPYATVSFTTDSTVGWVTVYRTTYNAGVYGSMQVFLDNNPTPIATLNNTSSGFLFKQPYTFAITTGVSHIITLKNVGSTYSDIDQIVLQTAASPLTAGTYQETQAGLIYNGIWTQANAASAAAGARKFTNDPNGTVSFTTDSTVGLVTIYRTTYNAGVYGSMQVFLDNNPTPIATLNNTSSGFLFQQPFTFAVTAGVSHIITLKNVGSTYSDIDQIILASST